MTQEITKFRYDAVVTFDITEADVEKMGDTYYKLKIDGIKDTEGYGTVDDARKVVKKARIAATKRGTATRADAILYQKAVLAQERRLVSLLQPIEDYLKSETGRIDNEKARLKAEEERVEQERRAKIEKAINGIEGIAHDLAFLTVEDLTKRLDKLYAIEITDTEFAESIDDAKAAVARGVFAVGQQIVIRQKIDKETEDRQVEEKRLATIRAEQEEERKRLDAINRAQAKKEVVLQAEKDKLADDQRKAQEKIEREEFERETKEKALIAAKTAEVQRVKDEEAQKKRAIALLPDKEKLATYISAIVSIPVPKVGAELLPLKNKFVMQLLILVREMKDSLNAK